MESEINNRKPLTSGEIKTAFRNDAQFPPLLSLEQAAALSHFAQSTIKKVSFRRIFQRQCKKGQAHCILEEQICDRNYGIGQNKKTYQN